MVRRRFDPIMEQPSSEFPSRKILNTRYQTGESRLLGVRHLEEVQQLRKLYPDLGFVFLVPKSEKVTCLGFCHIGRFTMSIGGVNSSK